MQPLRLPGVPLGSHWLSGAGPASLQGGVFLGLFALLAGLCWLSGRHFGVGQLMAAPAPAAGRNPGTGVLVKALPYLTVVIAAFTPLAAGIYLLTSMGWSLVERRFFFGRPAGSRRDQGAQQPDRR